MGSLVLGIHHECGRSARLDETFENEEIAGQHFWQTFGRHCATERSTRRP
uniref:Uncharacterized protein n=1 Tax=Anguilla anguilla TaxID=7936 RepID=A0A0E9S9X3_ANGAN